VTSHLPAGVRISPIFHGDPDEVAAAVPADPGLTAADEVVPFFPSAFGLGENVRLLTDPTHTAESALGLNRGGPVWFDPITTAAGTLSEDLSFCVRLAEVGIATHVHTGVRTTHHKNGGYLDEEAYDALRRPSPRG
jgi:hypothetical protein